MPDVTELGICQWFQYENHASVEHAVTLLRELGVKHLRTGLSWADWHRPGERAWYQWQMDQLQEFDVLLSVWHTPPSIAEGGICAGPPRRLQDYADFIWQVTDLYGDRFSHFELWDEPNNRYEWHFPKFDPQWEKNHHHEPRQGNLPQVSTSCLWGQMVAISRTRTNSWGPSDPRPPNLGYGTRTQETT